MGWQQPAGQTPLRLPSLRADAGFLDDRPPFVDLGLMEFGQALWCLVLARGGVQSKFGETRLHGRVGERFVSSVGRIRVQCPHPLARDFAAFSIKVFPSDQIAPGTRCASAMTASKDFSIQSQSESVMMKGGSSLIV